MRTRTCVALILCAAPAVRAQQLDVVDATIASTHAALKKGTLTCRALVQAHLDRIAAYDKQGPALNAVQTVNPRALALADSLDAVQRAKQPLGVLHCVPVLLKDQVETRDMPTTYGSALFATFTPNRDATIVTRLRAAGAIIIAKTTMGEFAGRYVGSGSGIVRNAYDPTKNPSGSSSGTGSGVAASFGLVGIGEDTGGSIRGPAAVSSLVGLRPTLPLVSRFGMLPANPTQDTMGPMTRTVMDAALLLDVIAGYDANDPITAYAVGNIPRSYASGLRADGLKGARVAVLRPARDSVVRDTAVGFRQVRAVMDSAITQLRALGATVIDSVSLPRRDAAGFVGNDFETEQATDAYFRDHPNAPVRTLKEILLSGKVNPWRARTMVAAVGKTTNDPGYLRVLQSREAMRVAVLQLMADQRLDAIIYATYDHPPTVIAADVLTNPRPVDAYGRGDNRGLSPSLGFPALTVPAGFTPDGLPVGLEFLGRPFSEALLVNYAFSFEQATHHRRPPSTTPSLVGKR
ncbi:MAG: amidase [Gemmatimonadaceae bacterium]|nr:amidase [Gemmatimonadaceae bacterium]